MPHQNCARSTSVQIDSLVASSLFPFPAPQSSNPETSVPWTPSTHHAPLHIPHEDLHQLLPVLGPLHVQLVVDAAKVLIEESLHARPLVLL